MRTFEQAQPGDVFTVDYQTMERFARLLCDIPPQIIDGKNIIPPTADEIDKHVNEVMSGSKKVYFRGKLVKLENE
jgi:hypothetical protein